MGVKLKDIIEPESINFKYLEGRTIAIDAFNTLYQFLSSIRQRDGTPLMDYDGNITSHLSGILYRNASIVEKGMKPIYIFDGKSSQLKKNTVDKRREIRDESEKKWKEALENHDMAQAKKYASRSAKLSPEIIESSKKLLDLMGIPYIEAAGEGEAQASYMVQKGDAWAVSSQDYDCLLFGANRVVRNLTINSNLGNLEFYELKKVLEKLAISQEDLIKMGILIGTDFNEGLYRVGAKTAFKYAKQGKLDESIAKLEKETNQNIDEVIDLFKNPNVNKDYKIKWNKPNTEEALIFLCDEHGFSEDRVVNTFSKLKKLDSSQKSLEDWF